MDYLGEGQQHLGELGIGAARYQILPFHTPTLIKVLRMVGLSLLPSTLVLTKNAKSLTHSCRGETRNLG